MKKGKKCPVCKKLSNKPSIAYEQTWWCDFCKDYFGKRERDANCTNLIDFRDKINIIRDGEM